MTPPQRLPLAAALAFAVTLTAQAEWDVPHRGAIVFERKTEAFEITPPPSRMRLDEVIAGAAGGGHEWRYFACPHTGVPAGFEKSGFDDAAWLLGRGEFGSEVGTNARLRTRWADQAICLRTPIRLQRKPKALVFDVDHDDGIRIWLNGALLVSDDGYGRGRRYVIAGDKLDAWQRADNLLAVQCSNIGGAQYLDMAVTSLLTLPPGVKSDEDILRVLREAHEAANRVQRELFGAFRSPPLLLQGDLDSAGKTVRIAPGDLRDIGWWIATDLECGTMGGSVQADAGRLYRLGDLQIKGRGGAVDGEGWQTIEVSVENTAEPAPRTDSKRHVNRYVRPHVLYGFDGKLVVRRRIEVRGNRARVVEFTTDLQGRLLQGADWKVHAADLQQRETWRHSAVRDNQDATFRAMVHGALDKGVSRMRELLKDADKGDTASQRPDGDRSYNSGRLALGLLALVKGGLPKDDEVVQRGYAALRQRALIDTYSLGNAIMAIEALYAPASEFGDMKSGTIDRPRKRQPSVEDKLLLERWTQQLLENVDTRVDPAYLLRFNYIREGRYDHSVNQYGLLGLYSAHLCGVELPITVWEAAANHLLVAQAPGGNRVGLELVDYRSHALRQADPGGRFTTAKLYGRPAGWSYIEPKDGGELTPIWGSMTCAGITGLAICQAALQDYAGATRLKLQNESTRARIDAFAWLAEFMTMRCHPGAIERQQHFFYYYLYSLERAALLSGVALIQDRDWYFEGAMVLVLAQNADGNWPAELMPDLAIERNAMAILFLKQSTLPVLTGK